jgi:hypothetical protein
VDGHSATTADTRNAAQVVRCREENVDERTVLGQKCASGDRRYARSGGKRSLGSRNAGISLRSLRIYRSISRSPTGLSFCKCGDPRRGVFRACGAKDRHAEVVQRQNQAAYGLHSKRPLVGRRPFDDDVASSGGLAETADLVPKSALQERTMKVQSGLPLDQHIADAVIADWKPGYGECRSSPTKGVGYTTSAFVNVHREIHETRMPRKLSQTCEASAPTRATSDFGRNRL